MRLVCSFQGRSVFTDNNPLTVEAQKLVTNLDDEADPQASIQKALQLVTEAINQNSIRAKTILGSMHHAGIGAPLDFEKAVHLFGEAAEAGDPMAQCSLGVSLLESANAFYDYDERKAVTATDFVVDIDEKGNKRGLLDLKRENMEGNFDEPIPAELVRQVRKARRKAGFTDQESKQFEEFKDQESIREMEADKKIALEWLQKAIDQQNDDAMVAMANEKLRDDPKRAVELYEQAVKTSRHTDAYYNLGQIFTMGVEGIPADEKRALKNFSMAAQLGDASAQFYMGHLYLTGSQEVNVDQASGRQYIEMAAEQNHPAALYYLALMHRNGEGGLEASEGAFKRYVLQAAKADHGPAYACLADMHYKGTDGVKVNYEQAVEYFLAAGQLGDADAYCSAAAMHFHGFGTEEDHHQALMLYQQAAQLGSVQALRSIGSMYFHGHGIPANKTIAEHFFQNAEEVEAKMQEKAREHTNMPIKQTPAPPHPMGKMPSDVRKAQDEDFSMEGEEAEIDEGISVPPKDQER